MYSYAKVDMKRFKNRLLTTITALTMIAAIWVPCIYAEEVSTGPALIAEICTENNITATKDEIEELAGSDKGTTSFWGLKTAAEEKGFAAKGLKTDIGHLKDLTGTGYVIVILSENRTYVRVKDVSDWFVNVHNPSAYPKADSISKDEFERQWDGKVLFIQTQEQAQETAPAPLSNQPLAESMEATASSSEPQVTALSEGEMQTTQGSNPCANPAGPAGPDDKEETEDPVILTNGDLHSTETDFFIETRGLIPLELTRTYNSQVVSDLEGWQPEGGAGPWAARDGVYNAYGDRNLTTRSWRNFTLTADVKTITPGTNPWETAWINFRYIDRNNRYYFIIKTDGILELTRVVNEQMTQLQQKSSSYSPLNWNTVKIEANEGNIKIYVNNNLEINYTDYAPILDTKPVGFEARYSYAQFDNVRIQSGAENYFYDFNTPDRVEPFGRGWSYNYGVFIKEFSNGNVKVIREDGRSDIFIKQLDGSYIPAAWIHETLTKDGSGFTLRKKDGTIYRFSLSGRLEYLEDRYANRITLTYENIYGAERLKYVTDPTNRQLTFEYWPDGKIKEVKDPAGIRKYQYVYNGIKLTQVIDPRGNSKYYEYNPVTNLRTAYIDREGHRYEYTYTYNARVYTQKDPDLNVTTFEFWWATTNVINNAGELWQYRFFTNNYMLDDIRDNLNTVTDYTWDSANNLTQLDEVYSKTTKFEYDTKGNVTKIIDAENGTSYPTILQYDPNYSLPTYKKDPKGNETTFVYDNGKLTEIHEPLSKTTVMTYYSFGKIQTLTDAEGNLTEFEYDQWGYPKKIRRHTETGVVERNLTYDIVGNLLSETDEEGKTRNYTYDENNNLKEIKDGSNNILASSTYDKNDNPKTVTDSLSHTISYEHDWAGNQTKVTEYDEFGTEYTTELTYDNKDYLHLGKSNLIRIKDQEGNITNILYTKETAGDGDRRLIVATDAENRVTKKQFDKLYRLAYLEDAAGKKTYYTFDYLKRLKTIVYPDSTSEAYTYDRNGNIATKRDRKYQTITYQFDALNRLDTKTYPDATIIDYTYDKVNNLKNVVSPTGTIVMTYDKLNRRKDVAYPENKTVAYEYYNNGLRKKLIYPDSTYITYHYDNLNRLTDIKDSSGNVIAHYGYDDFTNRRDSLAYLNGASINYEYNALNRIKSLKNKLPDDTTFSQFDYTYDKVGNRKTMTSNEGLYQYTYDKTYQLIDITYPDTQIAHYQYDVMGNREKTDDRGEHWDYTLKTNGLNQYASIAKTKHNIDVEGTVKGDNPSVAVNSVNGKISGEEFLAEDVTLNSGSNVVMAAATDPSGTLSDSINITLDTSAAKTFTYDNNGSLTGVSWRTEQTTYAYDYDNRLKSLTQIGGPNATYKYDYLGRRIEKNVDGTITKYVYDGDNIIAEYDSTGNLTNKYIYGPSIDEPIRLENATGVCYYHFDGLGSVTDLSNSSGSHIEHYTYSPFGKTKIYDPATGLKRNDSIAGNVYRFTARQWDSESSLYFYRARMYDPNLARFLQTDPIGYDADVNLYRYCSNNSINRVDPFGLEDKNPHKRPDESWDHYWARMRAARAKQLLDSGLPGGAALALGAKGSLLGTLVGGLVLSQADGPLPFADLLLLAAAFQAYYEARRFGQEGSRERPFPLEGAPGPDYWETPQGENQPPRPGPGKKWWWIIGKIMEAISENVDDWLQ